jgi:DNA adenine methylase
MLDLTRPVLRWHGGKWRLAPWIISHFPKHRVYVEPYGGAASVLLRKAPAFSEIYNDLDEDVVNLFRVLRCPEKSLSLVGLLELTPFARSEFEASYEATSEPVERARRLVVRSFMGFGSDAPNIELRTGFRAQSALSNRAPEKDWVNYSPALRVAIERLRLAVIECRPALDVMRKHDAPDVLHYVDPPYLPETRQLRGKKPSHSYAHEMGVEDHRALLGALLALKGMVILSGYPNALYDRSLKGWRRVEVPALADGARERTEVLWINPNCAAAIDRERMPLFSQAV